MTQPGSRPCIYSTKSARSRPAVSVGAGAGRVSVSHRAMAAAYAPHRWSAPRFPEPIPSRAAMPLPSGEGADPCPFGFPRCACRGPVVWATVTPLRSAGSCPDCRAAGWASPWSRPTPSVWAGAASPRRPGSGRAFARPLTGVLRAAVHRDVAGRRLAPSVRRARRRGKRVRGGGGLRYRRREARVTSRRTGGRPGIRVRHRVPAEEADLGCLPDTTGRVPRRQGNPRGR